MVVSDGALAATVNGNAFKDGQTAHSGITIQLETLPGVPALGFAGAAVLLCAASLLLCRKRRQAAGAASIVLVIAGLSCIAYAFATYTTTTNLSGAYSLTAVEPGDYRLDASAPGYYPEQRVPVSIVDGANTIPNITLYPFPPPGTLFSTDPIVGNMRFIPAGTFTQGSPADEPCRNANELQFTHTLTRNLAVMETEITRQMWTDLRAAQPDLPPDPSSTAYSPTMNHPVQNNMWYEAVLFANLLSFQNGYTRCYYADAGFTNPITSLNYTTGPFYCNFAANGYRLPSEGEWEYFTRAGTTTAFSCNETNYTGGNCEFVPAGTHPTLEQYCVYCANGQGTTAVVGSKLANPWNLKDVHGNAYEWCWDWLAPYPSLSATDYVGPESGSDRTLRGGSYEHRTRQVRSAFRNYVWPSYRHQSLGFRLVRTIP